MYRYTVCIILLIASAHPLNAHYYSQSGQDRYVHEHLLHGKRNGVFIDIGAHDGITYNNTYFFEHELEWTGICIEPIPEIFQKLKNNRRCTCIQGCIADNNAKKKFLRITSDTPSEYTEMLSGLLDSYDPRHLARIERELLQFGGKKEIIDVQCYNLDSILAHHNLYHVDYLSIDTEGSELSILQSIDFSRFFIHIITVENAYGTTLIKNFLIGKGYQYVTTLEGDEIYKR